MPEGRRRQALKAAARAMFLEDFDGRVLPFDTEAAFVYADLFAVRRRAGRPTATVDLMSHPSRDLRAQAWSRATPAASSTAASALSIPGRRRDHIRARLAAECLETGSVATLQSPHDALQKLAA